MMCYVFICKRFRNSVRQSIRSIFKLQYYRAIRALASRLIDSFEYGDRYLHVHYAEARHIINHHLNILPVDEASATKVATSEVQTIFIVQKSRFEKY